MQSGINKHAKGVVNTRTLTWKHRRTSRMRRNPIFDMIYNVMTITLSRNRKYKIFSNTAEPFVPYTLIQDKLESLPEETDTLFNDADLVIILYNTKKYKKENFNCDGLMQYEPRWFHYNRLKKAELDISTKSMFMTLYNNTFDVESDGTFRCSKFDNGNFEHKWNNKLCKHFFESQTTKRDYVYEYTTDRYFKYVVDFLLLHELGHMYDFLHHGYVTRTHYEHEMEANKFVTQINPSLVNVFDKDIY